MRVASLAECTYPLFRCFNHLLPQKSPSPSQLIIISGLYCHVYSLNHLKSLFQWKFKGKSAGNLGFLPLVIGCSWGTSWKNFRYSPDSARHLRTWQEVKQTQWSNPGSAEDLVGLPTGFFFITTIQGFTLPYRDVYGYKKTWKTENPRFFLFRNMIYVHGGYSTIFWCLQEGNHHMVLYI